MMIGIVSFASALMGILVIGLYMHTLISSSNRTPLGIISQLSKRLERACYIFAFITGVIPSAGSSRSIPMFWFG